MLAAVEYQVSVSTPNNHLSLNERQADLQSVSLPNQVCPQIAQPVFFGILQFKVEVPQHLCQQQTHLCNSETAVGQCEARLKRRTWQIYALLA